MQGLALALPPYRHSCKLFDTIASVTIGECMQASADKSVEYAATYWLPTDERTIFLSLSPAGLTIRDGDASEIHPYSEIYAGQPAQGEMECILLSSDLDARIIVAPVFLEAAKAAINGEDYALSRKIQNGLGPILLIGVIVIGVIAFFFNR